MQQQQQKQQPQQQQQQKKNKNNKKIKEENKVAAIFKESKGKPENEFEEWCISALEKLDPQVDIPTFLGFLNDVESPYEVPIYSLLTLQGVTKKWTPSLTNSAPFRAFFQHFLNV